ncbi:Uncharacterised protein [Shigella sonnei]|nr:Uncharacterised protein [Shigella sonnei]CSQ39299.1 Uncharacterised protein [Shigella sonnei]CSQ49813.1 Uncharacterised protein [Shigella sonnei]CSQ78702.1 Uncharacterised protein [Shigella sonnei]CSR12522.1 Uncharacterised protein [Shigella sonnei]
MLAFYRSQCASHIQSRIISDDARLYGITHYGRYSLLQTTGDFINLFSFCSTNRDKQIRGIECCDIPVADKGENVSLEAFEYFIAV